MSWYFQLFLAFLAVFSALGLYAFWIEPSSIRVVEHDIVLGKNHMPQALRPPSRIAVIADLHAGSPYINEAKMDRIVALTNAAEPDLILLAGDYVIQSVVGGRHIPIETIAEKLSGLSAPLGIFAILGNHDNWEDGANIARALEAVGIVVLENRSAAISDERHAFHVVGISDESTTTPNIRDALIGVQSDTPNICLTHSPDIFPNLPPICALTITGHTHGGQVWLPFVGRPVVPSRYGQRYAAGLIIENGKALFVSTGIGTSILPVRFGVPPEISILNMSGGRNSPGP
jgi:predicted MPP superfamily phosphohydrolase